MVHLHGCMSTRLSYRNSVCTRGWHAWDTQSDCAVQPLSTDSCLLLKRDSDPLQGPLQPRHVRFLQKPSQNRRAIERSQQKPVQRCLEEAHLAYDAQN